MFWPAAKDSVTVALSAARSPPEAVTSYTVDAVTSLTASVAVVPLTSKSAASTSFTFSSKVTRQVRLSAFVGDDGGDWRSIDTTPGAPVSGRSEPRTTMRNELPPASSVPFRRYASSMVQPASPLCPFACVSPAFASAEALPEPWTTRW